jgi:MerR family mercuric resistance operon transcriptional regulator
MKNRKKYSRGELAAQTGVNAETIRYYESIALMPEPQRTEGGHRVYAIPQIKRLNFIRRCKEIGFTLEKIRELLSLVDGDQVSCKQVKHIAESHLVNIRAKIADLKTMEKTLQSMSSQCSGKAVPECPIIEALQE